MAEKHHFMASDQQWEKKLKEWHLKKNLPKEMTRLIGNKAQRRLQLEGKKTKFFTTGEEVPGDKVNRYMRDYQGTPPTKAQIHQPASHGTPQPSIPPPAQPPTQQALTQQTPNLGIATVNSPQMVPEFSIHQLQIWNGKDVDLVHRLSRLQLLSAGKDVDDLLAAAEHAGELSLKGGYLTAKPILMDCLDGLEVLLGPLHAQFEGVLQDYVEAAVRHKDFDGATDQVNKSYNGHQGSHDKKFWKSMARLGKMYYDRGATSQTSHMLRNARQGLLAATSNDPEEAYNCVRDVTKTIAAIAVKQVDFDEAENELLGLIRQAEDLGEAYQDDALRYKHDLVHFYQGDVFDDQHVHGHAIPKRSHLERLLLEILQFNGTTLEITYMQACSWNKLREFYESTGQREKLIKLLKEFEDFLSDTRPESDEAKASLKEAEKMRTEILPPEHIFHSTAKQSIQAGKIFEECCPSCRVNPPGNIEMRTGGRAHGTEVAEQDEGGEDGREEDSEADSEESHEEMAQDQLVLASAVPSASPFNSIGQQECGHSMMGD
ncbi:hypothetical protein CDV36_008545 [Fusarium kuroshium]|uniref:Clr5 domain-containing protein n=1 Tax=Fusarium kuroshium TaxID=2010991 RepID=A0A3M2S3I5_9HYPO|nr:hypothetical protein CDV36_008545 [Fusarium kuroshium]